MDFGTKTHCFLLILSFCLFCFHFSTCDTESDLVVGTVYCDTCFLQHFSKSSHFISGASVSVECGDFRKEAKTNRHGVFRVRLPPKVNIVETCSVNLIQSNEPSCSVASSSPTSSTLRLKSKRNSLHVFSAGFFAFKPLKQPELCNNFDSIANKKQVQPQPAFFFPPPIPFLPSPPNVGGVPLPPNPLVPPPSIVPPVFPSPPPSVLPPIIPSPPRSLFPPIPLITPPPPPPASLLPPFPVPFPPNPVFPGNPPAPRAEDTSP